MSKIVLASGNTGKLKEFSVLLSELDMDIIPQSDFNVSEAEETGLTFVENALIKARNAALITGRPALADDSGIEVDALNGKPGIYSSRYAGENASDNDNVQQLLAALSEVPEGKRSARFQCVMVYLRHAEDPTPLICQGTWEGQISLQAEGEGGFGYDPVFFVPSEGVVAAELTPEQKNALSHRGRALIQLMNRLEKHPV